jgi:CheY-like chemotaxis protein
MVSPKRRILVVDDYVSAANATAQLLRLADHDVTVAYEAADVIPRAAEFQPDVILLDISLPGEEDGVMLARRLRASPSFDRVLLVAVTGYQSSEQIRRIRAAGFDHYLLKPVTPEQLATVVSATRSVASDPLPRDNSAPC